jgi:hypothetical protein
LIIVTFYLTFHSTERQNILVEPDSDEDDKYEDDKVSSSIIFLLLFLLVDSSFAFCVFNLFIFLRYDFCIHYVMRVICIHSSIQCMMVLLALEQLSPYAVQIIRVIVKVVSLVFST